MKPTARLQPSLSSKKRVQNASNRARTHELRMRRGSTVLNANTGASKSIPSKGLPELELYQSEEDPFSHAVRTKLSELGLDYVAHSVPDGQPLKHEKLVQAGGKDQIPFLFDRRTGVKLYNSDSIVAYLEHEYGSSAPNPIIQIARDIDLRIRTRADRMVWRVRGPFDKLTKLRDQVKTPDKRQELKRVWQDTYETLKGTYRSLRKAVDEAFPSKPVRGPRETRGAS